MKKFFSILLVFISLLIVSGCGSKAITTTLPEGPGLHYKKNIVCDEIKNIKDINQELSSFITTDGKVYILNSEQQFSNNKNCKLIESDAKMVKFINNYLVSETNELYSSPTRFSTKLSKTKDSNVPVSKNIIYLGEQVKYGYNISSGKVETSRESTYVHVDNIKKSYISLKENETIEYIVDNTIKTNLGIYIYDYKTINEEACKQYADIACESKYNFYLNNNFIYGDISTSLDINTIKFYKVLNRQASSLPTTTFVLTKDYQIYSNY